MLIIDAMRRSLLQNRIFVWRDSGVLPRDLSGRFAAGRPPPINWTGARARGSDIAESLDHDPQAGFVLTLGRGQGRSKPRTKESARRGGTAGASGRRGGLRAARAPPTQPWYADCIIFNCDQALIRDPIKL
jgi:hypothetical protein